MSSRSKEKVASALRRLFRGNGHSNNNSSNNNNNNNGNATASTQEPTVSSTTPPTLPPTPSADPNGNAPTLHQEAANGAAKGAAKGSKSAATKGTTNGAAAAAIQGATGTVGAVGAGAISKNSAPMAKSSSHESPGKRLCRQDNKVTPLDLVNVVPNDASIRARRLMKEFKEIQKSQQRQHKPIFTVELVDDSLFEWYARLHVVDPDSKLAKDMADMNIPNILLHLVFPDNFPFAPPFMRVVEPRIEKGYVMEGGAICMELLTPRGWASAYRVEAVIMQFAASLVKGQGRIVRKPRNCKEFTRRSAEESFRSLVKTHEKYGWVTPALSDG